MPIPSMNSVLTTQAVGNHVQDKLEVRVPHSLSSDQMIVDSTSHSDLAYFCKKLADMEHNKKLTGKGKKQNRQEMVGNTHGMKNGESLQRKKRIANKIKNAKLLSQKVRKLVVKLQKPKIPKQKEEKGKQKQRKQWTVKNKETKTVTIFPNFMRIQCNIPNKFFGDFMIVMEFLYSFKNSLPMMTTFFPSGVTFEVVERALIVEEVGGPFCGILQLLLITVFALQDEESVQMGESKLDNVGGEIEGGDALDRAIRAAFVKKRYIQTTYGIPLKDLHVDEFSLSEVLRLHLLTCGSLSKQGAKWKLHHRGGYTDRDDPGLLFCVEESKLLNELACKSVSELLKGDKLKLVMCLINQILTYVSIRDVIDKGSEKLQKVKSELQGKKSEIQRMKDKIRKELKNRKIKANEKEASAATTATTATTAAAAAATTAVAATAAPTTTTITAPPMSDEEIQKTEKEILHKQQEFLKKMKELSDILRSFQNLPLGVDEFRRYWMFTSLPGLFVEQFISDKDVPSSADNTTQYNGKVGSPSSTNKENCYPAKLVTGKDVGGVSSGELESMQKHSQLHSDIEHQGSQPSIPGINSTVEPQWYFCVKEDNFMSLLNWLRGRNEREGRLHEALLKQKENIVDSIQNCPSVALNPSCEGVVQAPDIRRSDRNNPVHSKQWNNLGFPQGTPVPEIWYDMLKNEILKIEGSLYQLRFGSIKVENRDAWREAIRNRGYDKQCDRLVWDSTSHAEKENDDSFRSSDRCVPDSVLLNIIATPYYFTENLSDPIVVKVLACAILQIKQGISKRYLKDTFHALKNWEFSLMTCSSFSQLYLHLTTLNNSIHWSKSSSKARCRMCRVFGDTESLIRCRDCRVEYHYYCFTPKLDALPVGDWQCPSCEQGSVFATPRKRKSSVEAQSSRLRKARRSDRCDMCGLGGEMFPCDSCSKFCHSECRSPALVKVARGEFQCNNCCLEKKAKSKKRR